MTYPTSPGAYFREIDLSLVANNAIATSCGHVGKFTWGPIGVVTSIANEDALVAYFGKPVAKNAIDFFLAASFLSYSNALNVVRVGGANATKPMNAVSGMSSPVFIPNDDAYDVTAGNISGVQWVAKYAGAAGNSLTVASCSSASQYSGVLPGSFAFARSNVVTYTPSASEVLQSYFSVGDFLVVDGVRYSVAAVTNTTLTLTRIYSGPLTTTAVKRLWAYAALFSAAPATDCHHVVVVDSTGQFNAGSVAGAVLEKFENVSTVVGSKYADGTSSYIGDVFVRGSAYIRLGGADISANVSSLAAINLELHDGSDAMDSIETDDYLNGWSEFASPTKVKLPLAIGGAIHTVISNFIIQNIAEVRRDTVAFFSPQLASVVNNKGGEAAACVADRALLPSTSYAAMDNNWKYMYDKYNDTYRWIPCAGDHAGIYARVDRTNASWWSAAGESRGIIKNTVKLAWNAEEPDRDILYPHSINPIVNFPDSGPTVFGDKTLLAQNTALSRINVRRLMLLIESIVVTAARGSLFEFNDEFTQARFVSINDPFLRGVKGGRGITDYKVVSDSTVNTPEVIANDEFVGQIYVKPNYSINFIRIDFVIVGATVTLSEAVVGA